MGNYKKICNFFGTEFHERSYQWQEIKERCRRYEISDLIENVSVTDTDKNFHVLLKTYEALKGKDDTYMAIKDFGELLSVRNIFAHVREEKNSDNLYQFKRLNKDGYLVLTDEKCIELRNSIKRYYETLSNIQ